MISRWRQRAAARKSSPANGTHRSSSTLLPTTYRPGETDEDYSAPKRASRPRRPRATAYAHPHSTGRMDSPCNSFLLGGSYYPGKDKKRSHHLRRRTVWYRIFCSSPLRIGVTAVLVTYVTLWHVFVPLVGRLLDYGRILSGSTDDIGPKPHKGTDGLVAPQNLKLKSIESMRTDALRLREHLDSMRNSAQGVKLRMIALEQIVPEWVHRNERRQMDVDEDEENGDIDQIDTVDDDAGRLEKEAQGNVNDREANEGNAGPVQGDESSKQRNIMSDRAESENSKVKDMPKQRNMKPAKVAKTHSRDAGPLIGKSPEFDRSNKTAEVLRTLETLDKDLPHSSCPANLSPMDISTTLVIQSSIDRLWLLGETCGRWLDPIVLVVHVPAEVNDSTWINLHDWEKLCPHLRLIPHRAPPDEKAWEYPVNKLRNKGLDAVKTSHVLVMDVDFIPSADLYNVLRETLMDQQAQRQTQKKVSPDVDIVYQRDAVVIPAFERKVQEPCKTSDECREYLKQDSTFIPRLVYDLRDCISRKECIVFQEDVNWEGHYTTHSRSWLKGDWYDDAVADDGEDGIRKIKTIPCFDSLRYEPYVVLPWCPSSMDTVDTANEGRIGKQDVSPPKPIAPYYDERFHGYGKNKIQLISHLRFIGYKFSILPRAFIVHHPHPESAVKKAWNDVDQYRLHQQMDDLYPKFLMELAEKYEKGAHALPQCNNGKPQMVHHHVSEEEKR